MVQQTAPYAERLLRSPEGIVAGVCEGLAARFGIPANLLRAIWIAALLFFGSGLLLYGILWWILPRADRQIIEPAVWIREPGIHPHPPLRRTQNDRKLFGVCGGIARRYDIDPSVVRLIALATATLSLGIAAVVYAICAIVLPAPHESRVLSD